MTLVLVNSKVKFRLLYCHPPQLRTTPLPGLTRHFELCTYAIIFPSYSTHVRCWLLVNIYTHFFINIHQYCYQWMCQMYFVTDETIACSVACHTVHQPEVNWQIRSDMWWICIMLLLKFPLHNYCCTVCSTLKVLAWFTDKITVENCWYRGGWHSLWHYLNSVC